MLSLSAGRASKRKPFALRTPSLRQENVLPCLKASYPTETDFETLSRSQTARACSGLNPACGEKNRTAPDRSTAGFYS